jgi:hypothetical protein
VNRDATRAMENSCQNEIRVADAWLIDKDADEPTRVYWRLVKQASELWLEQNTKNKRPLRKRPRLRRPEAG